MAELEGKVKRPKEEGPGCTCTPKHINHYVVAFADCKRHDTASLKRKPADAEYWAGADKIQGQMLYKRQQALEKAEAIIASVHARAAAEGRKATFADVRRAAGIPDFVAGEDRVKIPYGRMDRGAFNVALAGMRNERNAEKAMVDPPPEFDPNAFDPWREAQKLDRILTDMPDDQEHAEEFAILTDIRHWLDQNRECGKREYQVAANRIRAAATPPDELED